MISVKLEKFEGPLDFLLALIQEEKLDITEVSLSRVTDQYLEYLEVHKDIPLAELADFLVVAAKLLLLKSKAILPTLEIEEEEEGNLERQLKIYEIFHDASKNIQEVLRQKRISYSREGFRQLTVVFAPPSRIGVDHLHQMFQEILKRIEPIVKLPESVVRRTISLQEKIREIQSRIGERTSLSFQALVGQARDRMEVIVTFLALLELVKQQSVVVAQDRLFGEIKIHAPS